MTSIKVVTTEVKKERGKIYYIRKLGKEKLGLFSKSSIKGDKENNEAEFNIPRLEGYLYYAKANKDGFLEIFRVIMKNTKKAAQ